MNRREFFKVVVTASAVAAMPSLVAASEPDHIGVQVGSVRELWFYHIEDNSWLVRMEIMAKDEQLGVDFVVRDDQLKNGRYKTECRQPAFTVLTNAMKHQGIAWSDLTPIPIPANYVAPVGPAA